MKILVLGSEGFIGSHTVRHLRAAGHTVHMADIVLKESPDYFLINPEYIDFATIFIRQKYDACINATGAANVQLSFTAPGIDFALNAANVFAILNSIREHNPDCRFMNLSSASVYGNPDALPVREDMPLKPLSPYGFHKMYSEQICSEFHRFYGLHTTSVRIFSAYGEGLKKQLFWDLYQKVEAAKDEVEMFGTGQESRDFIYIDDLVAALECVLLRGDFNGGPVNIASGVESTIAEAVGHFIEAFGTGVTAKFNGKVKLGDPLNWRADISTLEKYGFRAKVGLREGIHNYCAWLKGRKSL